MSEWNGILVIAEHRKDTIHPVSYELLGKGRELADSLNCSLNCLLLSANNDSNAKNNSNIEELNYRGADTVYLMTSPAFACPEEYVYKSNIVPFINQHKPGIVLIGATAFGRSLAPRIAASLKTGLTADCTELSVNPDGSLIQIRPAFSGNILAHIKTKTYPQMATVRHGEFPVPVCDQNRKAAVVTVPPYLEEYTGTSVTELAEQNTRDITEAQIIVACGRGIRAAEDIALVQELADHLGGQVGFSRALVDAGLADAAYQIGYSGSRVKPKLYIACGISGAPQHLAGMKDSGTIIAINRDPSAPIFNVCDIGYVGDMYQLIPLLIKAL